MEGSAQGQWQSFLQTSPWSHTTQFLLYVSGAPRATVSLPEPRVSAFKQSFVSRPFKRMLRFLAGFRLTWADGILADFYSSMFCGLLFLALVWGPLQLRYPSWFSTMTFRCRVNLFTSLPLLPVSTLLLLYILSCRTYVQLGQMVLQADCSVI